MEKRTKLDLIKEEVYNLFLAPTDERKFSYVRRDWIFPNHFEIMLDLVDGMVDKYGGNKTICKIAVLLHDVGLVYGRDSADSTRHEERSIKYAREILKKYNIDETIREEIIISIKATDAKEQPESLNAKIVRTADALSQFVSVHFFAKSTFSGDWNSFQHWLKKKVINNFKKICFEDEKRRAEPTRDYIINAFELYEKYNEKYPLSFENNEKEENNKETFG